MTTFRNEIQQLICPIAQQYEWMGYGRDQAWHTARQDVRHFLLQETKRMFNEFFPTITMKEYLADPYYATACDIEETEPEVDEEV